MLLASARAIAEQVKVEDGVIEALIPPSALERFATDDKDNVAYRITGPDGTLLAGHPDLAFPYAEPKGLEPLYANTSFRQQNIRTVALRQPLASDEPNQTALVVVGETLRSHDRIAGDIWRRGFIQQMILVAIAGALTWFGLNRGLTPVTRLRNELLEREPDLLEPFSAAGLQTELQPLVAALNEALARVKNQIAVQRRFIADAAHQLRTPLTLLKTQASVGRREDDLSATKEAFTAIISTADAMTRLSNQLLTLAKTEPDHPPACNTPVDLALLVQGVFEQYSTLAMERKIDMALKLSASDGHVRGDPTLLRELIVNLLDNALKYTPVGGGVTLYLSNADGNVSLRVEDNGFGIPAAEQEHVFERFYRVLGTGVEGSGLGLSIVAEVARLHRGHVSLFNRKDGSGLSVEVRFFALRS
jgi:two-component system sensor histidine kinase TctE